MAALCIGCTKQPFLFVCSCIGQSFSHCHRVILDVRLEVNDRCNGLGKLSLCLEQLTMLLKNRFVFPLTKNQELLLQQDDAWLNDAVSAPQSTKTVERVTEKPVAL